MNQLKIKTGFPLGIAWSWVKFSFATFREKPINFLYFAFAFTAFSVLPVLGSFLATLALIRIYIGAKQVNNNASFGLSLYLGRMLAQANLVNYAILNVAFELVSMAILRQAIAAYGINTNSPTMLTDPHVVYLILATSAIRAIFFGIAGAIMAFNPKVTVFGAIRLSLLFIIKNWAVILLSLFVLIPIFIIPLYLAVLLAVSVSSNWLFFAILLVILLLMLVFLAVSSIFCYKLYQDGIIHE